MNEARGLECHLHAQSWWNSRLIFVDIVMVKGSFKAVAYLYAALITNGPQPE